MCAFSQESPETNLSKNGSNGFWPEQLDCRGATEIAWRMADNYICRWFFELYRWYIAYKLFSLRSDWFILPQIGCKKLLKAKRWNSSFTFQLGVSRSERQGKWKCNAHGTLILRRHCTLSWICTLIYTKCSVCWSNHCAIRDWSSVGNTSQCL